MPHINSTVKKLDDLFLHQLPSSRPINCEKVVRCSNITVFIGRGGKMYCIGINDYSYSPGEYPWTTSLMICLNKIGYLTDEQVADHTKLCGEADNKRKLRYAEQSVQSVIDTHGKEFIEEMISREKKSDV